jgi:hypothetical protein
MTRRATIEISESTSTRVYRTIELTVLLITSRHGPHKNIANLLQFRGRCLVMASYNLFCGRCLTTGLHATLLQSYGLPKRYNLVVTVGVQCSVT